MNFATLADFFAMGGHAPYVWSAYGISLLVLLLNVAVPLLARRRYVADERRRIRREEAAQ
ncbi:heme exporter protein CcmD [Atopomonas sediminilitoris]|uniref:heme exporter protein CcmD n=1 Tax=Atopomonas sediminilitoris TaxID=2919919 RepID=UPI001F4EF5C3|nr:heme exporter protein CcmD [Atopomonas sediminilitoris]MCJ8167915.1 heme exporter protein CcmD [Atopomonas sediminilitoris]